MKKTLFLVLLLLLILFFYTRSSPSSQTRAPTPSPQSLGVTAVPTSFSIPSRTKSYDCQIQSSLPDSACTPGAIISGVTKENICTPGYASSVRNVSDSLKKLVYQEYGVTTHPRGSYEVDHLISLELGGSNDIANLWPEAASPTPGFKEKDKVENYLHDQVCQGKMSLNEAQYLISTDWLKVYNYL